MSVIRRGALALAAASLATIGAASSATIGLAPSASATASVTGTGGWGPPAPPVTISSRTAGGNTIVTQVVVLNDFGVLSGTDIDMITYTSHPDGTVTFRAVTDFTGMVAGRPGTTIALFFDGTGNTVSFQGHIRTLSGTGTGALATLHGEGPFQGSFTTGAGTYVFHYHFDS